MHTTATGDRIQVGHIHLGTLPSSRKWRAVADLIQAKALPDDIIAFAAAAAERDLMNAVVEPVFVEAVRLLMLVPHAARAADFGDALRRLDLPVSAHPDLMTLLAAIGERLDVVAWQKPGRGDMAELAARTLTSTLSVEIGAGLPGLFETDTRDVQIATKALSSRSGIAILVRAYFGGLVSTSLASWLDRSLSAHVGSDQTFPTVTARNRFDVALAQYSHEASRIIEEFAPGWFGKRISQGGTITSQDAAVFGAVCVKKIVAELRKKRDADD